MFGLNCTNHPNEYCQCDTKKIKFTESALRNYSLGRAAFLTDISNQVWQKNKVHIQKHIIKEIELKEDLQRKQKNSLFGTNRDSEIIQYLYNLLNTENKLKCIEKFKEFNKISCSNCHNIYLDKNYQCLHTDCSKMCLDCYKKWDKKSPCPSCHKIQNIECPLCFENTIYEDLTKGNNCHHSICWKCYGMAFQKGKPITSCPICREQFNKKWTKKGKKITELEDLDTITSSEGITYYLNPNNYELYINDINHMVGTYNQSTNTIHLI